MAHKKNKRSVTFTALIWLGMILALLGAIVAILGFGGAITFEGTLGSLKVQTTSVGLAIMIVGAFLSGTVATNLPKNVQVLGDNQEEPFITRIYRRLAPPLFFVGFLGVVLLAIFLITKR